MREYMMNLGTVLMMIAIAQILMPEGNIKKFSSLAMGFIVITVVVSPIKSALKLPEFDAESYEMKTESIESTRAKYRAEVLQKHAENLEEKIAEKIKHGSKVSVQVSNDGELTGVTIVLKGDESEAVLYIVETLKLPRERIRLNYDSN